MTLTVETPTITRAPRAANRTLGFSAVLAMSVMELLDSTVVSVAAPTIREDLGGTYSLMQWLSVGYTLAMAALLLVGGRLGDVVGRRRMMQIGVTGFTAASLLCALAWTPDVLLVGRLLQGAAGALMIPQAFGLIRDLFPPADVPKALAALGPVMGIGALLGPVVGGVLVEADLFGTGWRAIFLINVPIGLAALAVARRHIPAVAPTASGARIDVIGALIAAAGAALLIFPLVQGAEHGWPAYTVPMLVVAVALFAVFGRRQVRLVRAGRTPLVQPSVFRHRAYVAGAGFAVCFLAAMGALFTIGVMLQIGLGFSPLTACLVMAPWALGAAIGSGVSGTLMAKHGRKLLHVGLALMATGILGLTAVYQLAGTDLGFLDLLPAVTVGGFGMGMIFVPLYDIILAGVDATELGSATGVLKSIDQIGTTMGVAVLGTVFFLTLGPIPTPEAALHAGTVTAFGAVTLLVVAFAVGFLLPKHARPHS
ncbi:MFS transporter [Pseudonocardia sp. CA-107938]|uniref:MFS transporter n=1 Tax=Pseudonocardia sp. CA-107938 TaxID=3240021 RepID=UPI003D8BD2A0